MQLLKINLKRQLITVPIQKSRSKNSGNFLGKHLRRTLNSVKMQTVQYLPGREVTLKNVENTNSNVKINAGKILIKLVSVIQPNDIFLG